MSAITPIAALPQLKASAAPERNRAALERLLRDRLRKFMSLLPKVLAEDSVEAVHDLRVWSRRLQQVVATVSTDPRSAETRTIVRALRRARRALGGWRNCDVLIDLLVRKERRARSPEEKKAYAMIRDLALSKRDREIRGARRKLASRKLFTLAHRAQKFLQDLPQSEPAHPDGRDPAAVTAFAVAKGYAEWRAALSHACQTFDPLDVHAFRISTKRLRYRIELARDLGERDAEPALHFLRSLQDVLGAWHDQVELLRLTAQALADSEFLLKHTRLVALLLGKSDRQQVVQSKRVRRLLVTTNASAHRLALDNWVSRYCREMPAERPLETKESPQPEELPHSTPCANELAPAGQVGSAGALVVAEAPALAAGPIEDFVKAMNALPR